MFPCEFCEISKNNFFTVHVWATASKHLKAGSRGLFSQVLSKMFRSSPTDVFLGKAVLKICSKFTVEHACRSVISMKLLFNFVKITLTHVCSPVNLLHIFRTPFYKNTGRGLLLDVSQCLRYASAMFESVPFQFFKKMFRSKIRPSPGHS